MVYHKVSSAVIRSTRSRMVSMQRGWFRWATSRTNWSAWPSGSTRSVDSSPQQVQPHLVSHFKKLDAYTVIFSVLLHGKVGIKPSSLMCIARRITVLSVMLTEAGSLEEETRRFGQVT